MIASQIAAADHLRLKLTNLEAVMQESGVGQSASNGVSDRLLWEVISLTRKLINAAAEMHGVRVGPEHAFNVWAVRHAGVLLSCTQRTRDDGRTAYERRFGKPHSRMFVPFSEPVFYAPALATWARQKHEERFLEGIHLGAADRSNDSLVACATGVVNAGSINRRSDELKKR